MEDAREALGEVEIVFSNIIHKPDVSAGERVSMLKKLAAGFEKHLTGAVKSIQEIGIKEIPHAENEEGISMQKDAQGNWRFLGYVTNNFKDRDGEIISEEAHKEFVSFLNDNPELAPEFWSWHSKETARENKIDWWSYTNGFLLVSGKLTTKEARILSGLAKKENLGMSHGFYILERDPENKNIITKYRSFEVSDLPLHSAANAWTDITLVEKETKDMSKLNNEEYLAQILGKEEAQNVLNSTALASEALNAEGVDSKEIVKEEDKAAEEEGVKDTEEEKGDGTGSAPQEVIKAIADQLGMPQLSQWVDAQTKETDALKATVALLVERVDNLQVEDDEKIAKQIAPPIAEMFAWKRPSESKDNVLDKDNPEDKELLDSVPETGWFTSVSNGAGQVN